MTMSGVFTVDLHNYIRCRSPRVALRIKGRLLTVYYLVN